MDDYTQGRRSILFVLLFVLTSCASSSGIDVGKNLHKGGLSQNIEKLDHPLQFHLFLWKDHQPGGETVIPLNLTLQIKEKNGGQLPEGVVIEKLVLQKQAEEWVIDLSQSYRQSSSYQEINASADSSWPIGSAVNAHLLIRTTQGVRPMTIKNIVIKKVE